MPKTGRIRPTSVAWDTSLTNKEDDDELLSAKQTWVDAQKSKTPIYEPTREIGAFEGVVGYLTGTGLRVFPVYKTHTGLYFYLYERDNDDEYTEHTLLIDPHTTKVHSIDWFLKKNWFINDG